MNDNKKLEQNKLAREAAEDCFNFIDVEFAVDQPERFWEVLLSLVKAKLPNNDVETLPMDDLIARRFERSYMPPKGIHASKAIGDVPTEYLAWWIDNAKDNFTKQLERYVRSARFRERERAEG